MENESRLDITQATQPSIPPKQADYPRVRFWHRVDYSTEDESDNVNGRNLRQMEDENGTPIPEMECQMIREYSRSFFNQEILQQPQNLPRLWREATGDLIAKAVLAITTTFPNFRLCDNNWKVNHFISPFYSDWKETHPTAPVGITVEQTRVPNTEGISVSRKRKHTTASSPIIKRTRTSASTIVSVEGEQDSGGDKLSTNGERSGSEVRELQAGAKVRRKVSNITPLLIPSFTNSVGSEKQFGSRAQSYVSKIAVVNIPILI